MTAATLYRFSELTLEDLPLLRRWLSNPHVRKWWASEVAYDAADLADPRLTRWIVSTAGRPIAFMQDYSVHGWKDHHFAALPTGSRGIDQYIGEPDMIGIGHGQGFIGARMKALFDAGVPVIATDPHPDNERAIAAYRKLGFEASGPPRKTRWGLVLPMLARQ